MDYVYHSMFSDVEITETEFRSELEQLGIDGAQPLLGRELDKQLNRLLERFGKDYYFLECSPEEFRDAVYKGTGLKDSHLSRLRSRIGAKRREETSTRNYSKLIDSCIETLNELYPKRLSKWSNQPGTSKRQWVAHVLCGKLTPDEVRMNKALSIRKRVDKRRRVQVTLIATIASMLDPEDLNHLYDSALRAALSGYQLPIGWGGPNVQVLKEYAISKLLIRDPGLDYDYPLTQDAQDALQEDLEQTHPDEFISFLRAAIETEDPLLAEFCLDALSDPVLQVFDPVVDVHN